MATAIDRNRLRSDVGADENTLSDAEADALFAEAAETYSDETISKIYARVLALQRFLASQAKLASYRQNEESEDLSDVFDHIESLLDRWQARLAEAVAAARVPEGARPFAFSLGKATAKRWYP